jgi:hypothetical protein
LIRGDGLGVLPGRPRPVLHEHRDRFIDELWLDHDLGGDDTIMPVVTLMEEAAFSGRPFHIGTVFVHSANPIGADTVVRSLTRWNYHVRRTTALFSLPPDQAGSSISASTDQGEMPRDGEDAAHQLRREATLA